MVPKNLGTHGGDDVAVFARGPWAHLFIGNYEQSFIPFAEAYAAQIQVPSATSSGEKKTSVPSTVPTQQPHSPSSSIRLSVNIFIVLSFVMIWKNI